MKLFPPLFFCAFFSILAVSNVFAQPDFEFFANKIKSGTTEQKRTTLFQLRDLKTAEASRIALPSLSDKEEIVRVTAVYAVLSLPADEAAQNLLPLLNDKSDFVRRETAYALGKTHSPIAVNPITQKFQNEKIGDVKNACVIALGEIGDVSAIDFLTQILQKKAKKDDDADEFMRRSAARAVGQIAQIIQTGKREVFTPEMFLSANSKSSASQSYKNLAIVFPVFIKAENALIQILQSSTEADEAKREAAFALGIIGEKSAVAILQSNLNSKDYYLAKICAESLTKLQNVSDTL